MENKLDIICKWLYDNNENMTNLRLQKLLYFIQAYMLVAYERPAFNQEIVAWRYGPVVREAYQNIKFDENYYKNLPLIKIEDRQLIRVLVVINNSLGYENVYDLVERTHKYETWRNPWQNGGWGSVISKNSIKEFHEKHIQLCNGEIF